MEKIKQLYTITKEQGRIYTATILLIVILPIILLFSNISKIPIIMLLLSGFLTIVTLTANIIKGEHRLKEEISCEGFLFILLFMLLSTIYIFLSNPECDTYVRIIQSLSALLFNISIFFMGNLLNLIKTKDK